MCITYTPPGLVRCNPRRERVACVVLLQRTHVFICHTLWPLCLPTVEYFPCDGRIVLSLNPGKEEKKLKTTFLV